MATLSDRIFGVGKAKGSETNGLLEVDDVKEFVNILKKEFCYDWLDDTEECNRIDGCSSCKRIDKLTGFALHENSEEEEQ